LAYITPHTWTSEQATVALMNEINNNLKALFPVGSYTYLCRSATTAETLVNSCWLECNGVSVLRATYPDLNTLLSGLGYPFGTVDGTRMTLPDAQGRSLASMASGGHADVNGLGDSDGLAKAERSPKHNTTVGVSGGTLTGAPSINDPGHDHGFTGTVLGGSGSFGSGSSGFDLLTGDVSPATTGITAGIGTLAVSGLSGSGGPGGTRPFDTIPYLVGGVLFIKAYT
jgi:hypothetical protein